MVRLLLDGVQLAGPGGLSKARSGHSGDKESIDQGPGSSSLRAVQERHEDRSSYELKILFSALKRKIFDEEITTKMRILLTFRWQYKLYTDPT